MNKFIAGAALMLFASLSQAQYMWIDEKGLKQFSDRPPPASLPKAKILKAPGLAAPQLPVIDDGSAPPAAAPAAAPPAPAAKRPPTLADRNADFNKRQKEQAEKEQKAVEEAQLKKEKDENCKAARQEKAQLDSGVRMGSVDNNGERTSMGDDERTQRSARAGKFLESCR